MNGRVKRWSLKRQQRDLTRVLHRPVEVAANSCRLALVGFTSSTVPKAAPTDLIDPPSLASHLFAGICGKWISFAYLLLTPSRSRPESQKAKNP